MRIYYVADVIMKISVNSIALLTILIAVTSFSASACCCSCSGKTGTKTTCFCSQKPATAELSIPGENSRPIAIALTASAINQSRCDCVNNFPPAEKKSPAEAMPSNLPALKNNCGPVTGTFCGNDMRSCMISRASTTRPPLILSLSAFPLPLRI